MPLDSRNIAHGHLPTDRGLPADSRLLGTRMAAGGTWIAGRYRSTWYKINFDALEIVAVVSPSILKTMLWSRSFVAPEPEVVFRSKTSEVLKFGVGSVQRAIWEDTFIQVAASVPMTNVAKTFLRSGRLPGRWGLRYHFVGWRFGPTYETS